MLNAVQKHYIDVCQKIRSKYNLKSSNGQCLHKRILFIMNLCRNVLNMSNNIKPVKGKKILSRVPFNVDLLISSIIFHSSTFYVIILK